MDDNQLGPYNTLNDGLRCFIREVADWHRQTFSNPNRVATAKKVLEEAAELYGAVILGFRGWDELQAEDEIINECCDVIIAALAMAIQIEDVAVIEAALRQRLEAISARGAEEQHRRDVERGIYGP